MVHGTYFLLPMGCQMNQSDAERVVTVLEEMGFVRADHEEQAQILGIVACSVRQKPIDKAYGRVQKWRSWKSKRPVFTFITGCVLPADESEFLERFDLFFHINDLPKLPEVLRSSGIAGSDPNLCGCLTAGWNDCDHGFWRIPATYSSQFEAYVPIQNGCDKFCAFCAVPYTRGREVSRHPHEVLHEVRTLIGAGYKSITLLGQNVNSYGRDHGHEVCFSRLLGDIGRIGDGSGRDLWVYFTSPHPSDMTDDVLEAVAQYRCVANHIHLPLQSGDDGILSRMNRHYTLYTYRDIVDRIRQILPKATLSTDIIVGFPGETQDQFENTRRAMDEFQYNMAYIALYSPRPGAASYRWRDDVPLCVKKDRLHALSEVLKEHSQTHNERLVGRDVRLLVETVDRKPGCLSGRTEGRVIVRFPSDDRSLIGQYVNVTVRSASPLSVAGQIIREGP